MPVLRRFHPTLALPRTLSRVSTPLRELATRAAVAKKEGDISSVFVSLSGAEQTQLPAHFADLKRDLIRGNEERVLASWQRLLRQLASENEIVASKGPGIVPQIEFTDIERPSDEFVEEVKKRGVVVVRGVIPEEEARGYKAEVEEYVGVNPWTKGFPSHAPAVFELYWSRPQMRARSHPNLIAAQRFLMKFWHAKNRDALISTSQPLAYADRVRIRQPGDAGFALGPHVDGGSIERWEPHGYGLGGVYDKVWKGRWEEYDSWESSSRLQAVQDNYAGAGACSMFRMFQGWLSMSHTSPLEGTLMVNPMLQLSTAYFLLRPFFVPLRKDSVAITGQHSSEFLDPDNWILQSEPDISTELHGASPGHGQELNQVLHPHLDLGRTMVHVPKIKPGDFVVWHCDTVHAVDKVHVGRSDSSVLYIPVCPMTESNVEYLARQRDTFLEGYPGPDFPGGSGESEHTGRSTELYLREHLDSDGLQAMGLEKMKVVGSTPESGADKMVRKANAILGF